MHYKNVGLILSLYTRTLPYAPMSKTVIIKSISGWQDLSYAHYNLLG